MSLVLLVANILSIGFGISLLYLKGSHLKLRYIFLLITFVTYLIIVMSVSIYDAYLTMNLNSFDINGDGMFTGNEISSQQEEALNYVVNDSGRNMIYITGLVNSFLLSMSILFVYILINIFTNFTKNKNNS